MRNQGPPHRTSPIADPIFLVGAERSGTTMLRLMLDSHPAIAFHGEFEFLVDSFGSGGRLPSRKEFESYVSTDRVFQHWNLTLAPGLDFVGLANDFLEQRRIASGATLAGATVHRHFDRLLQIWPGARFIHMVRDGRDVAMSRINMGWAGNMYNGILDWVEAEALWAATAKGLSSDRHITLHYERLVENPAAELDRICQFLGIEYDHAMLEYPKRSSYSLPARGTSTWPRREPAEIAAAEFRAARWLRQAGYPLSQPVAPPRRLELLRFRLQDRMFRIEFKRRRYGTGLWLEDVVSRRARSNRWRETVRHRVHTIENQLLK